MPQTVADDGATTSSIHGGGVSRNTQPVVYVRMHQGGRSGSSLLNPRVSEEFAGQTVKIGRRRAIWNASESQNLQQARKQNPID